MDGLRYVELETGFGCYGPLSGFTVAADRPDGVPGGLGTETVHARR
ncbi:hypothetical protein HUO13_25410 [Saccharopolyspora erythraea]|nr:hypothetical protein [Saccharopolyspora erythraea]QUH03714.1 hypothetical protein HUO13_25410 [Saccharopolyspora erythraea]